MKMIYLDYAASAPPYPQVREKMGEVMAENFGNSSGIHSMAEQSRLILRQSRRKLAELLGMEPQQIFFTSGATEANNWAVKLGAGALRKKHMAVFAAEHSSVLASARYMETQGYAVSLLYPDREGLLSIERTEAALRADTGFLCIQSVNNETGVKQDVRAIAELCRKRGILYFCDGVQSFGHCEEDISAADMLSLSAHKLGGPAGMGLLAVRRPDFMKPFIHGGGQELGYRAGTENVAGAAGFALAAELAFEEKEREMRRLTELSEFFVGALKALDSRILLNGAMAPRRSGIVNLSFPEISGEELVLKLDRAGICASPGAACGARSGEVSHVLSAMGLSKKQAENSVRFSFGRLTTRDELEETVQAVGKILGKGE